MNFATWLSREASGLLPRQAPASLQTRVLEQLARRAARPWWQRPFPQWPVAARGVLLLLSVLGIRLTWELGSWMAAALTTPLREMRGGLALLSAFASLTRSLIEAIPVHLLYGMVGFVALTCALLLTLGAIAYRNFHE